jgi:hypothetical protein
MASYSPQRTQYPFSANTRYKTKSDSIIMQNQWDIFERVENYDDVIFQRVQNGLRDLTYYQFVSNQEYKDYKRGQELHILTFPSLPASTFASIRDRPLPTTPSKTPLPYFHQVDRYIVAEKPISADELTHQRSDTEIYMYVSTFNDSHVYKYTFISDEEKMAYYRAEKRIRST